MKRIILILVMVLMLFIIMMAVGLNRDDGDSRASQEPGWMSLLDGFVQKTPVTASDFLPASCFAGGDFAPGVVVPCAVHIRSSANSSIRTLKLIMVAGLKTKIDLQTSGKTGMNLQVPLRTQAPKSPEFQIPKEGADLKVICEVPAPNLGASPGLSLGCRLRMTR